MSQQEGVRETRNPEAQANKGLAFSWYSQYPRFLLKNTRSLKFPQRIKSEVGTYCALMLLSKPKQSGEDISVPARRTGST